MQNAKWFLLTICISNVVFAASAQSLVDRVKRDSNSAIATRQGVKAFAAKQYGPADAALTKANGYRQSAATLFNLGTARIANGRKEEGSAALTQAMADPRLRADALYNRGNSALAANAYDYAIRDYVATLKLRPNDADAKRNLEIAMQRRQQQQQQSSDNGRQQNPNGSSQQQKQEQKPSSGNQQQQPQPQQPRSDASADALLRAVQQQEQEELSRMKRARAGRGRVGW